MKEPVVADSSCLIGLENIGRLDLLPALFDPILAAPEVQREFGVAMPWLRVEAPAGAANLEVRVIGTVGVLVNARKAGLLPGVKGVLGDLEANGFFISSELKAEAMRLVGE